MDLEKYGFLGIEQVTENSVLGRVSEVQRELCKVICENGEVTAKLKGTFYKNRKGKELPAVGDYVLLQYNSMGHSLIEKIGNRKSSFSRADQSGHAAGYVKTLKKQVVAVNFDYVFILVSLNHDFNENRIVRYISTALEGGGKPVVVLTKADLCETVPVYLNKVKNISEKADVFAISSKTGEGLDQLTPYFEEGKTIVFLGSSGVGKSSLVNAVAKEEIMQVNEIREKDSKGRHTTTHRQLIVLPSKAVIIDTPGLREVGILDVENGLRDTFSDISELFLHCKYTNCNHEKEPGCAIQDALADGTLPKARWETYQKLQKENEWGKQKSAGKKR